MNIELLEKVKAEIEANPECFDYSSWEHCIAGITCRVAGLRIDRNRAAVFVPDVGPTTYHDAASHLLGLSDNEAKALFVFWPPRFGFFPFARSAKGAIRRINAFIREKGYTPRERQGYRFDIRMVLGRLSYPGAK